MTDSKLEIDQQGNKYWYNSMHKRHRKNAPAVVCTNGNTHWFINGIAHRIDGPVDCWYDGIQTWCLNNKFVREFSYD